MKTKYDKEKFLSTLEEFPIVSVAAKRSGISRSQIYRWRKKDKKFTDEMNKSLTWGRENINDLAESQVITGIRNGSERMTKFWLENNCKRYVKPRPVTYLGNIFGSEKQVHRNVIVFKDMGEPKSPTPNISGSASEMDKQPKDLKENQIPLNKSCSDPATQNNLQDNSV